MYALYGILLWSVLNRAAQSYVLPPENITAAEAAASFDVSNFDERIVGGTPTSINLHPYQVSLQYKNRHLCGGSIVQKNVVITAAHCVDPVGNPDAYSVRVGTTQRESGGRVVGVRRIFRHEGYSRVTLHNDVALLQLDSELSYSQNVKPVRLASLGESVPDNGQLIVSGWGLTNEMGNLAAVLHHVVLRLIDVNVCAQNYKNLQAPITSTMFCAGYLKGGRDSCQGDSGGPLVSYVQGEATLFGIVSWGVGCAKKGFPGVYTKVSVLRPWLNSRIDDIARM